MWNKTLAATGSLLLSLAAVPAASAGPSRTVPVFVRDSRTGLGLQEARMRSEASPAEARALDANARAILALPEVASTLHVTAPGYAPLRVPLQPDAGLPLTVWLDPLGRDDAGRGAAVREDTLELHGHVVDAATGRGVSGARVRAAAAETAAGRDGSFRLELLAPPPPADHQEPATIEVLVQAAGYRRLTVHGTPFEAGVARRLILDLTRGRGAETLRAEHGLLGTGTDRGGPSAGPEPEPGSILVPGVFASNGIKVGTSCACRSCSAVSAMSLETYVERGLDNEWLGSWDTPQGGPGRHALRAGAVAYRSYGASFVVSPINSSYDVCSSTCCQAYDTSSSTQSRHAARFTHSTVLSREGTSVFRSEYSSENNSIPGANCVNADLSCGAGNAGSPATGWTCLPDHPSCTSRPCLGHGRGMCQYGSSFWARYSGKDHLWILDHYYNANFQPSGQRSVYVEEPTDFAAAPNADGRLEVFGRWSSDNGVRHARQPSPGSPTLSAWSTLNGGALLSRPSLAVNADGRLQVVVRGTTNVVWTSSQTAPNAVWSGWTPLSGVLAASEPALARNANGRLQVFVRATDYQLYTATQISPGGAFGPWTPLDGILTSAPAVGVNLDGRLQVFVRGVDDRLYTRWQDAPGSGTWAGWFPIGGLLGSEPAVARNDNGTLEVFVRGVEETGPAVWRVRQTAANGAGSWGAWSSMGGATTSAPTVVANGDGRLQVFTRGFSGELLTAAQTSRNGGFTAFGSLGGVCTSAPAAALNADGRLQVFVRGLDRRLYSKLQAVAGGGFSATWNDHAGSF